jgi:hypothetical protein
MDVDMAIEINMDTDTYEYIDVDVTKVIFERRIFISHRITE